MDINKELDQRQIFNLLFFDEDSPTKNWKNLERTDPTELMRSNGSRFWAVIIGNDRYPGNLLDGCVNDARLMARYISDYRGVPESHIRVLENADRKTMIDSLYDLRDDTRIKFNDNILIHYSGHGSVYFPIDAICPVDRGDNVPDISDRELNSIFQEIQAAKGLNTTFICDCCYPNTLIRCLNPRNKVRYTDSLQGERALERMLEAADSNPRRGSTSVALSSSDWVGTESFAQLTPCKHGGVAYESTVDQLLAPEVARSRSRTPPGQELSPRYGAFTWALIKILESEEGQTATYASIIPLIGRLGSFYTPQTPMAWGSRKHCRIWFEDDTE